MALKIGKLIINFNSKSLKTLQCDDTKTLWSHVGTLINKSKTNLVSDSNFTAEALNQHYAAISTDNEYQKVEYRPITSNNHEDLIISEYHVFNMLDNLKCSSSGPDEIPAWFLRLAAPVLSGALANIYTKSLNTSVVPIQWKVAQITPIAKISNPTTLADYRPISVTSILSRLLEKHVVKSYLYPTLLNPPHDLDFSNQYAFRPSGSCTAALIAILSNISELLKTNEYVIVVALDFSRAFDSVKHGPLFEKYNKLDLNDKIYNWMVSYFEGRRHTTKFQNQISEIAEINASIVQGSGVGPF